MQMEIIMKGIGKMIKPKALEFINISKVHDMKEIGKMINKMDKVQKVGQMGLNS